MSGQASSIWRKFKLTHYQVFRVRVQAQGEGIGEKMRKTLVFSGRITRGFPTMGKGATNFVTVAFP